MLLDRAAPFTSAFNAACERDRVDDEPGDSCCNLRPAHTPRVCSISEDCRTWPGGAEFFPDTAQISHQQSSGPSVLESPLLLTTWSHREGQDPILCPHPAVQGRRQELSSPQQDTGFRAPREQMWSRSLAGRPVSLPDLQRCPSTNP